MAGRRPRVRRQGGQRLRGAPTWAWARRATALLVGLSAFLLTFGAAADGRLDFLIDHLKYPPTSGLPDDYRVRTQAALNLGGTNDDGAVTPLCDSLQGDPNDT